MISVVKIIDKMHVTPAASATKARLFWQQHAVYLEMSSVALAVSGGVLALASLLLKRASERDKELLREMCANNMHSASSMP